MASKNDAFGAARGGAGSDPRLSTVLSSGQTLGDALSGGVSDRPEHFSSEHRAVRQHLMSLGPQNDNAPIKVAGGKMASPGGMPLPSDTSHPAWKGVSGYTGTPKTETAFAKKSADEAEAKRKADEDSRASVEAERAANLEAIDTQLTRSSKPPRNPTNDPFKPTRRALNIKPLSKRKPKAGKPQTVVSAVGTAGKKEVKETTLGDGARVFDGLKGPVKETLPDPAKTPGTPEFKAAAERRKNLEDTITGLKTGAVESIGDRGPSIQEDPNIIKGTAAGGKGPLVKGVTLIPDGTGGFALPHKEIDPYTGEQRRLTDSQKAENDRHADAIRDFETRRSQSDSDREHIGSGFDAAITDEKHKHEIAKRIAQLSAVKGAMSPAREGDAPRDFMRPRPTELAVSMREHLNILKSHANTATGNAGRIGFANTHLKNAQDSLDAFDTYTSNRARGGHEHLVAAATSLGRANDTLNNLGTNRDTGEIQQGTTSIPASKFLEHHLIASSIHGFHSPKAQGTAGSYDLTGTLKDGRTAKVTVNPGTSGALQVANNIEQMQREGRITGILKEQLDQMRGLVKTSKTPESEFKRAQNQQQASILGDHYKTLLDHMVTSSQKTQTVLTPGGDRISEERPVTISGEAAKHHTNAKMHLQAANSSLYSFSQSKGLGDNKAIESAHNSLLAAHAELSHPSLSDHIGVLPISAEKMTESYMAPRENLTLPTVDRGSGGRNSGELMAGTSTPANVREGDQPQGNMETPRLEVRSGGGISVPEIMKPVGKGRGVEGPEKEDPKLVELREGLRGAIKKGDSGRAKTFKDALMAHKLVGEYREAGAKPLSDEDYILSDELEGPEKAGK